MFIQNDDTPGYVADKMSQDKSNFPFPRLCHPQHLRYSPSRLVSKPMKESLESTVFSGIQPLDIKSSFLSLNCFSWQATGTSSGNKNRKKEKEKEDTSLWVKNRRNPSYN